MADRKKTWTIVAVLFTVGNVASAVYAAFLSEQLHTAAHVALAFLGVYWVRWLNRSQPERDEGNTLEASRIEALEQSIDAVALEVERLGEAQRFAEKLHAERVGVRQPEAG